MLRSSTISYRYLSQFRNKAREWQNLTPPLAPGPEAKTNHLLNNNHNNPPQQKRKDEKKKKGESSRAHSQCTSSVGSTRSQISFLPGQGARDPPSVAALPGRRRSCFPSPRSNYIYISSRGCEVRGGLQNAKPLQPLPNLGDYQSAEVRHLGMEFAIGISWVFCTTRTPKPRGLRRGRDKDTSPIDILFFFFPPHVCLLQHWVEVMSYLGARPQCLPHSIIA